MIYCTNKKFLNCQISSWSNWFSGFSLKKTARFFRGVQSDGPDQNSPRYGFAISRTYSWGRASGSQKPFFGFSIIHITAVTTPSATWMVVAFCPGASFFASSIWRMLPVHHEL